MVSTMLIELSPNEQTVYDLIPNNGKRITTKDIVDKVYGKKIPLNGRLIITGIIRTLEKKTEDNNIQVKRGPRRGPRHMEVWKEKR